MGVAGVLKTWSLEASSIEAGVLGLTQFVVAENAEECAEKGMTQHSKPSHGLLSSRRRMLCPPDHHSHIPMLGSVGQKGWRGWGGGALVSFHPWVTADP